MPLPSATAGWSTGRDSNSRSKGCSLLPFLLATGTHGVTEENRTPTTSATNWRSTIELRPPWQSHGESNSDFKVENLACLPLHHGTWRSETRARTWNLAVNSRLHHRLCYLGMTIRWFRWIRPVVSSCPVAYDLLLACMGDGGRGWDSNPPDRSL